jgi:dipeptidase E
MKRIVLFSTLTESNRKAVLSQLFPLALENKVFSFIPSNGVKGSEPYIEQWRAIAQDYNAEFNVIDNSVNDAEEQRKLLYSNIILISGGNTFGLLQNLRNSGLDKSIKEFTEKSDFVLAGFSAGALVLTPTIEICSLPGFDENLFELKDLTGLSIVNFEVFPHYNEHLQKTTLENYRKTTANNVREIADEDYITLDY